MTSTTYWNSPRRQRNSNWCSKYV